MVMIMFVLIVSLYMSSLSAVGVVISSELIAVCCIYLVSFLPTFFLILLVMYFILESVLMVLMLVMNSKMVSRSNLSAYNW